MATKKDTLILLSGLGIWLFFCLVIYSLQITMDDAISKQRLIVANETKISKLGNYSIDNNGTPIRAILLTTFGSEINGLTKILSTYPGAYHHFAPLLEYGPKLIRNKKKVAVALKKVKDLLYCNYHDLDAFLSFGKEDKNFLTYYGRQNELCEKHSKFCFRRDFLSSICKFYPLQSMTIIRFISNAAFDLLTEASLNVRIVLLVRDPRGTMQSRKHREWCAGNPDCDDPAYLCNDLVDDYYTAEELLQKYPSRFRTLRYEDLSLNPYEVTQDILQFYGLPFDPMVEVFLDTHTKVNIGGVSSTYRDSRSAPFHWKQELKIDEIKNIQNHCLKAMELWGYRKIENFTDYQHSFDPIILPQPFA